MPAPFGPEQRHHLAGCDLETQVEDEGVAVDPEVGAQARGLTGHAVEPATQRSRRLASTTTDTSSSTRESTIADSGSVSRAR